MTQIPIRYIPPSTNPNSSSNSDPNQVILKSWDNPISVGTVLAGREDDAADLATITLLYEVEEMRRKLRIAEPMLSKMITDFGLRRGQSGYREFYLRNELNAQAYKEK
jgi:hypothetical protein